VDGAATTVEAPTRFLGQYRVGLEAGAAAGVLAVVLGGSLVSSGSPALAESRLDHVAHSSLALPYCRVALGLPIDAPAAELLQKAPGLSQRLAATPACRPPLDALARVEQLEQKLLELRQQLSPASVPPVAAAAEPDRSLKPEPVSP